MCLYTLYSFHCISKITVPYHTIIKCMNHVMYPLHLAPGLRVLQLLGHWRHWCLWRRHIWFRLRRCEWPFSCPKADGGITIFPHSSFLLIPPHLISPLLCSLLSIYLYKLTMTSSSVRICQQQQAQGCARNQQKRTKITWQSSHKK